MNSPQINGTLIYSIYSDNDNNFDEVLDEFACENESECLDLSYERNLCNDSSDSSLKDLFYADSSPKNQSKINIPIFFLWESIKTSTCLPRNTQIACYCFSYP